MFVVLLIKSYLEDGRQNEPEVFASLSWPFVSDDNTEALFAKFTKR